MRRQVCKRRRTAGPVRMIGDTEASERVSERVVAVFQVYYSLIAVVRTTCGIAGLMGQRGISVVENGAPCASTHVPGRGLPLFDSLETFF